ncbi:uncharacterized protein LOC122195305 isoform X2 [Lactuca sativa]|uniref:uncharacterized protein LOC122195305 isoform X2 n=1 Tax=Lactuca sativa TaxID=4236 RepID=UPI001C6929E5|nr:uncharacterized protein LOC122195305 isoform X2 [Lactuca sativa]
MERYTSRGTNGDAGIKKQGMKRSLHHLHRFTAKHLIYEFPGNPSLTPIKHVPVKSMGCFGDVGNWIIRSSIFSTSFGDVSIN